MTDEERARMAAMADARMRARIAELEREIGALPGWGAGVSVRLEEIASLKRALKRALFTPADRAGQGGR